MQSINDKYIKIRKINNIYYGINLFTEKILYNPLNGYIDKNLSNYTINRLKQSIKELITFEKAIDNDKIS